ncbi:MAG TPA: phosphatase PAP2 family protein, partial [Euzebyales bacterium]|nr:phosphatase PAP2 family protein [Euzebyales bacterium]
MSPRARKRETVEEALARRVEAQSGRPRALPRALRELAAVDRAAYDAVASTPTATLDTPLRRLSNAANYSRLWFGIAAALGLVGGRRGRRAALEGLVSIGVTSATVNLGLKRAAGRARPDLAGPAVALRHVRMPGSTSFPSGHAASASAFAYAAGRRLPLLSVPLRALAAGVGYSRVHTGVHSPGDVVAGAILGAGISALVAAAF